MIGSRLVIQHIQLVLQMLSDEHRILCHAWRLELLLPVLLVLLRRRIVVDARLAN